MEEVHRRSHLVGTNLFRRSSCPSSAYAHDKPPPPLLLRHKISWKHLQEPTDSNRLEEFNSAVRSDRMVSVGDVVIVGGGREKMATSIRIRVPTAPERGEVAVGGASTPERTSNGAICSPSRSATAPPPDDIFDECNRTNSVIEAHRQVPVPASGEFCAGEQDAGQSSPSPSGKRSPSSHAKPAEAVAPSSAAAADDASSVVSLYELGLAAASAMDDETLLSEVAKFVGVEANQERRPQRRAVRLRKTAAGKAAPVYFSLRLSDEEAMEDVAAVSLPKDVHSEAEAPPVVHRNGKRRRNRD